MLNVTIKNLFLLKKYSSNIKYLVLFICFHKEKGKMASLSPLINNSLRSGPPESKRIRIIDVGIRLKKHLKLKNITILQKNWASSGGWCFWQEFVYTSPKHLEIGWCRKKRFGYVVPKLRDSWSKRSGEMIAILDLGRSFYCQLVKNKAMKIPVKEAQITNKMTTCL